MKKLLKRVSVAFKLMENCVSLIVLTSNVALGLDGPVMNKHTNQVMINKDKCIPYFKYAYSFMYIYLWPVFV